MGDCCQEVEGVPGLAEGSKVNAVTSSDNRGRITMSPSGLTAAIEAKALSADSIQCLAYLLTGRIGVRSDAIATAIGRRLRSGNIAANEAEWLVSQSGEINLSVFDELEQFEGNK